jgi:hypothetical protein
MTHGKAVIEQQTLFTEPPLTGLAAIFDQAAEAWGFNCGPGALCGALGLSPDEVRPHLGKFEHRKYPYMSPSDMWAALNSSGCTWWERRTFAHNDFWPFQKGICRVQWGGPWCDPGRPPVAAYRHTHWVAARRDVADGAIWIFDVNNPDEDLCPDGWLPEHIWAAEVVPVLLPRNGDGRWWITHTAEIAP